jgi:branched-subunit amino acid transport protein
MLDTNTLFPGIAVMALVTYLIRMLPLTLFRKKITSPFLLDVLYYVPYAVLSAMTIPAIFHCSNSIISALVGTALALVLAYRGKSLLTVSIWACVAVFMTEWILPFLPL